MEGYEIYGRYSKKPYGKEQVVSVLPRLFGPKVVEIPAHYPLKEVRELARRVAKQHEIKTIVTEKDDTFILWIEKR